MDRVSKLMVFLVVAVTLPALLVAAPPAKTQKCIITGDILSDTTGDGVADEVEIGISASTWVLIDGESGSPSGLELRGDLLDVFEEFFREYGGESILPPGWYYGHARVLKKYGRFDFEFGLLDEETGESIPCESPTYVDVGSGYPPPLCPYGLIIRGLYNKTEDVLTFDSDSSVSLMDYTLGPLAVRVGNGPVSTAGITVQFLTDGDGDEIEDETGPKKCKDGVDNDGDGDTDCEDDDCAKWCR